MLALQNLWGATVISTSSILHSLLRGTWAHSGPESENEWWMKESLHPRVEAVRDRAVGAVWFPSCLSFSPWIVPSSPCCLWASLYHSSFPHLPQRVPTAGPCRFPQSSRLWAFSQLSHGHSLPVIFIFPPPLFSPFAAPPPEEGGCLDWDPQISHAEGLCMFV